MDNFLGILKNKKVIIPLVSGLLVLILLIIIIAPSAPRHTSEIIPPSGGNNGTSEQSSQQSPEGKNVTITHMPVTPTQPSLLIRDWILSDNDVYQFQYPTDWKMARTLFSGGQTVSIQPISTTINANAPSWSITLTKTDPNNPITNKEKYHETIGFKKSLTSVSFKSVPEWQGVYAQNAPINERMQETHIAIILHDYSYLIVYKYPGATQDPTYETLFKKITNTVSIGY